MKLQSKHTAALFRYLLLITALLIPGLLQAQTGGFTGASFRIGFNARGMAMGNAMTATTSEGVYAYYNPAHAARISKTKQVDLTVGALSFDRVYQSSGAFFQLPPSAGLAFTLIRTGVKDMDGRTRSGYHTGYFDVNEYQLSSNFGIRFSEKFQAGIGIKFSVADYHSMLGKPVSVGVDLGALLKITPHLNTAIALQDLFATYTWNSQDLYNLTQSQNIVNQFPTIIKWGFAYEREKYTISTDLELQVYQSETVTYDSFVSNGQPTLIASTDAITTSTAQFRLGGSWKAHERFTLRGGWQLPDATNTESWALSSGFSVHLPFDIFSPSIDYAFVMEPYRVSNMHVFSLRLNL